LYFILHYLVKNARAQVKELMQDWATQLPTERQESVRLYRSRMIMTLCA